MFIALTTYYLLLHGSNRHSVAAHPLPYLTKFFQEGGKRSVALLVYFSAAFHIPWEHGYNQVFIQPDSYWLFMTLK